jgi:hypothetical protein
MAACNGLSTDGIGILSNFITPIVAMIFPGRGDLLDSLHSQELVSMEPIGVIDHDINNTSYLKKTMHNSVNYGNHDL